MNSLIFASKSVKNWFKNIGLNNINRYLNSNQTKNIKVIPNSVQPQKYKLSCKSQAYRLFPFKSQGLKYLQPKFSKQNLKKNQEIKKMFSPNNIQCFTNLFQLIADRIFKNKESDHQVLDKLIHGSLVKFIPRNIQYIRCEQNHQPLITIQNLMIKQTKLCEKLFQIAPIGKSQNKNLQTNRLTSQPYWLQKSVENKSETLLYFNLYILTRYNIRPNTTDAKYIQFKKENKYHRISIQAKVDSFDPLHQQKFQISSFKAVGIDQTICKDKRKYFQGTKGCRQV